MEKNQKVNKGFFIFLVFVLLAGIFIFLIFINDGGVSNMKEFNDCLADNGIVIYGSEWCPFCTQLVEKLGGYDAVENVYVDQMKNPEKYNGGLIEGKGIPQIHINSEVYIGLRDLDWFEEKTGCQIPN